MGNLSRVIAPLLCAIGCGAGGRGGYSGPLDAVPGVDAPPRSTVLDLEFGDEGVVQSDLLEDGIRVAVQADGMIVVAGELGIAGAGCGAVRFTADGALDTTFGDGGLATFEFPASEGCGVGGLAIQGTSILVGIRAFTSETQIVLCRLTATGTLDPTFGNTGAGLAGCAATEEALFARGVAVMPDQTIRFAADHDVYRYDLDGAVIDRLDLFPIDPLQMAPRAAGGVFVSVNDISDVGVLALSDANAPIAAYGTEGMTGRIPISFVTSSMAVHSDDRAIVGTKSETHDTLQLARFTPEGAFDPTFGVGGIATHDIATGTAEDDVEAIAARLDGTSLVFAGNATLALDAAGERIATFGDDGVINIGLEVRDAVVQPDGKVIAVGRAGQLELVRLR